MTRQASDPGLGAASSNAAPQGGSRDPLPPPRGTEAAPPLGREARRRIGRNLRLLYAEVLIQPLPDRFTALLDGLTSQSDSPEAS